METKKAGKQTPIGKTAIEFVITISIAAILFSILNFLGVFAQIYNLPADEHAKLHKILLLAGFCAAALAVFALRRWFELRKAYKKLAESEEKLRLQSVILDEIGDGITATDIEGKITYVNQTECNWMNRNKDELIGKSVEVYGDDSSLGATQQQIIETTLSKGQWSGEIVNTASDGSKIIVECHTWLMRDKAGKPTGLCGVSRNITRRRERRQELLKHKRYLEALDNTAGILLHSISEIKYEEIIAVLGDASDVNRVIVFLKQTDQNNRPVISIRAQWHASKNVVAVTEKTYNFFMQNIWPNWEKNLAFDKPVCLLTSDSPADEPAFWNFLGIKALLALPLIIDGRLEGFISFDNCTEERQWTISEIEFLHTAANNLASAMKRLEIKKELKEQRDFAKDSEVRLKTIFDDSFDGILLADVETKKFQMFNKTICKMLGYTEEEILHLGVNDIHPEKDLPYVIETFERQARKEIKLAEGLPVKRKDGSVFYADVNTSPITLGGRKYLMGSFRDITERKQAEQELKKAHSELEQRVEQRTAELKKTNLQLLKTIEERDHIQKIFQETEKLAGAGKLAAQIAHEINNPLAGIKNSFLLIKDAIPQNHQYFEYVGRIEKEINRVSQIVKQMFDLYRPGTPPASRFRLYDTIKDIAELLKAAGREKRINIEIDCDEKIIVTLSDALLRQIIFNIVQNAIQASGPDTTVKIRASSEAGRLNLSVSDEGPGIDEKIKGRIFEPFFTTGLGGPESGLGMGLAITKDIINAMNGEISFTSPVRDDKSETSASNLQDASDGTGEKNKGTVFNISIPIESEIPNLKSARADKSQIRPSGQISKQVRDESR